MDRLNFSPQASPTGQYHRPEVRASDAGSDLAQIAQALGQLSPKLASVSNQLFAADLANREAEVKKYLAEKQITNQKQFKALVDAGQIPWAANPWSRYFADTLIAGMEVEKTGRDLFAEYSKQGMQNEKDVVKVESFIDDHFSQQLRVADRNPDEMRVIYDRMRQIKDNLLERHVSYRAKADIEDMALGAEVELGSLLASGGSSEAIDKWRLNAERFLPKNVVNDMLVGGVASYAEATNNPSLFEQVLSQIKTPGGDLLMIPRNRERASELYIRSMELDHRKHRLEQEFQREAREEAINNLTGLALDRLSALRQTKPDAAFDDVGFGIDDILAMKHLPEPVREALVSELAKFDNALEKQRDGKIREIADELVRAYIPQFEKFRTAHPGQYPIDLLMSLMLDLTKAGVPVRNMNDVQNLMTPILSNIARPPQGNEELFQDMLYRSYTGVLNASDVYDARASLSSSQFEQLLHRANESQKSKADPVKGGDGLARATGDNLETRIQQGWARRNGFASYEALSQEADLAGGDVKLLKDRIDNVSKSVVVNFRRAFEADLQADPKLTYKGAVELADKLANDFAKNHGGLTEQEFNSMLDPETRGSSGSTANQPEQPAGEKTEDPAMDMLQSVADLLKANTLSGTGEVRGALVDDSTFQATYFRPESAAAETVMDVLPGGNMVFKAWDYMKGAKRPRTVGEKDGAKKAGLDQGGFASYLSSPDDHRYVNVNDMAEHWKRRKALRTVVQSPKFQSDLRALEAKARQQIDEKQGVTAEVKSRLIAAHNTLYEYDILTQSYGYDFDEVAAIPNGWKTMSLFQHPREFVDPSNQFKLYLAKLAKLLNADPKEFAQTQYILACQTKNNRKNLMTR